MPTVDQLTPTVSFWAWRASGACQHVDEDLFYHGEDERKGLRRRKEQLAKEVCAGCPVLEQCRSYALEAGEAYGVWGGLTEMERYRITREKRHRTNSK